MFLGWELVEVYEVRARCEVSFGTWIWELGVECGSQRVVCGVGDFIVEMIQYE